MRDPFLRLAPVMTVREVVHLERLLLDRAAAARGPLDVFEWGSGGSTVYFPEFLRSRGVPFSWVSAEHSPHWESVVNGHLGDAGLLGDVRVKVLDPCDFNPKEPGHWAHPMGDYVNYPLTLGRRFDVVVVDGRRRRRCLGAAEGVLAPGGLVVLHDAGRPYYRPGIDRYPSGRWVPNTTLWEGGAGP